MSRIKIVLDLVEDLRKLALSIETLANAMESNEASPGETAVETSNEEPITIEKVRAVLSEKSQSGKQPQVKALITKHGVNKLTDIDPDFYPELLAQAQAL